MVETTGGGAAIIGTLISVIVLAGKAIIDTLNRSAQRVTLLETKLDSIEKERSTERSTADRERISLRAEIEVLRDELRQMQYTMRAKDDYTGKVEQQRDTYKLQFEALQRIVPAFSGATGALDNADTTERAKPGAITGIIVEPGA